MTNFKFIECSKDGDRILINVSSIMVAYPTDRGRTVIVLTDGGKIIVDDFYSNVVRKIA